MNEKDILIVDDEDDIRSLIKGILEDEGYKTREAGNAVDALRAVEEKEPDLVILDIWLQGSDKDGMDILKTVKEASPILPVLMISGHGTIETAVSAIKLGAYDFIEKPFQSDRLLLMITRALETAALRQENKALKARTEKIDTDLIGESNEIKLLRQQVERIAPTNSRVLITGEAGTGKEVVARALHNLSERKEGGFIALNCAALHPKGLEEELFGVLRDGKIQKGVFELAHGGTLFLDEVADMPLETQGKILRVLQDNKVHPVGSQIFNNVDVRILASTNQDLSAAIAAGDFREDLYYRLNVVTLDVPLLNKRRVDVLPLAAYFLKSFAQQMGQDVRVFNKEARMTLESYNWPGNVRQLKNIMEWVTIMSPSVQAQAELGKEDLPPEILGAKVNSQNGALTSSMGAEYTARTLREARSVFEREYLSAQIKRFKGNVSQTADFVGMERSALHRKLKALDISLNDEQDSEQSMNQDKNKPRKIA